MTARPTLLHPPLHTDELAVWSTSLPGVKQALIPSFSDLPAIRLSAGMLFVSVFTPGCVYALDATTGAIRWRCELPRFGSSTVTRPGIWEFCPYGPDRDTIYS